MKIEGSNSAAHDTDYDNSDGRAACRTNSGHYGVLLGTKYPNGKISSQNQKIDQLGMRSKKGHKIRKVRKVWHKILQRRETSVDFLNSWLLRGERSFILILVPKQNFRFHKKLN